jgi:hypothetical protein
MATIKTINNFERTVSGCQYWKPDSDKVIDCNVNEHKKQKGNLINEDALG